ncbi:hypothetical protein E3P92_03140 [Wallemia ichthyophaga]|uniref:Uncharacterized protein n=2 Tax=Wallemia ichthyophaga TaxID=245174 RepID=A0A4T0EY15_WALIC|nr:uncharacterized protein J056_003404 [Wallemia ichthyophaga EXF-994]TIA79665.1 hypothetical protein E3P98_03142 [Wallemia ichthyophaga]EOR02842.1 hypothetical protein J056_003404 [Wallemia ichthyophaga EXF-994]TIA96903.1 hypothetical protein E3P95_03066 [Wallemia ichthyophaga]TIA98221.1 hypothetical protein E3P94_03026 [Wallemia ichthyophaga]TIB09761.1 hypothetical protein E3P93_03074 [Wallemia ichthyophaga]
MSRKVLVNEKTIGGLLSTLNENKPSAIKTVTRRLNQNTLNSRPIPAEIGAKIDELYDKYKVVGCDETAIAIRRIMTNIKGILDAVDSERKDQILMSLWLVILLSRKSDSNSEQAAAELNNSAANPLKMPSELTWYTILSQDPLLGDHWREDSYAQSDNLSEWSDSESEKGEEYM